jgi:hypothetical protein
MTGQCAASIALMAILTVGCDIEAQTTVAEGSFERTLQAADSPDVSVTSRSGEIRVVVGPAGTVRVRGVIRAQGGRNLFHFQTAEEQLKAVQADPPVEQHGRTVEIGERDDRFNLFDNVSISYEVTVPGDARLTTVSRSGAQTLAAVRGPIDASTRSGDIRINGAPASGWSLETRSGDVEVRTPETAAFDVRVETRSGSIHAPRAVEGSSEFTRRGFSGRVRGGGARVAIQTRSGSVTID